MFLASQDYQRKNREALRYWPGKIPTTLSMNPGDEHVCAFVYPAGACDRAAPARALSVSEHACLPALRVHWPALLRCATTQKTR